MKIFGIGLERTGTTSLTEALRVLGYTAVHLPRGYQSIKAHDASTDTPVAARFAELDFIYPNSKFILTARDKDSWIKSVTDLMQKKDAAIRQKAVWYARRPRPSQKVQEWLWESREIIYKTTGFDEEKFLEAYDRHHSLVFDYFKDRTNDLLVLNLKEENKWEKLCGFLVKTTPIIEYPHIN